jgi:DNA-binding FadR family transcriptional regulator
MTSKMLSSKPFKKQTLAERVADSIEDSIVRGAVRGGDMLPTEPEMAEQFGVSRAVVRDATRMLAAKGLIEVQHGKGSFVTETQIAAFGDALLLALRRMEATNWDVAQFEQLIYPEIVAMAAGHASDEDVAAIQNAADRYLAQHAQIAARGLPDVNSAEYQDFMQRWADVVQAIFDATHNKVISLLARPLIQLHGARDWEGLSDSMTSQETRFITTVIGLIRSRDPEKARNQMRGLMELPPEAVAALQKTAVASPTKIVLSD